MKTLVGVFDHSCIDKVTADLQALSISNITLIDGKDLPKEPPSAVVGTPGGISGGLATSASNPVGMPYIASTQPQPAATPAQGRVTTYLRNKGVPADEVNYFASALKEKAVLILVKVLDNQAQAVKAIFDRYQQSARAR